MPGGRRSRGLKAGLAAAITSSTGSLLELGEDVTQALQLQPTRCALDSAVPADPTIYRFYEGPQGEDGQTTARTTTIRPIQPCLRQKRTFGDRHYLASRELWLTAQSRPQAWL